MNEEKSVSVGTWRLEGIASPEIATVTVYEISSAEAVSRWLQNFSVRQVAKGWTFAPYDPGLRSYLARYRNSERFDITSGRGRFLLMVSGTSRQQLERVARILLQQVEGDE
jgi:hypothetical protein